jgi:hypothetical protein
MITEQRQAPFCTVQTQGQVRKSQPIHVTCCSCVVHLSHIFSDSVIGVGTTRVGWGNMCHVTHRNAQEVSHVGWEPFLSKKVRLLVDF